MGELVVVDKLLHLCSFLSGYTLERNGEELVVQEKEKKYFPTLTKIIYGWGQNISENSVGSMLHSHCVRRAAYSYQEEDKAHIGLAAITIYIYIHIEHKDENMESVHYKRFHYACR